MACDKGTKSQNTRMLGLCGRNTLPSCCPLWRSSTFREKVVKLRHKAGPKNLFLIRTHSWGLHIFMLVHDSNHQTSWWTDLQQVRRSSKLLDYDHKKTKHLWASLTRLQMPPFALRVSGLTIDQSQSPAVAEIVHCSSSSNAETRRPVKAEEMQTKWDAIATTSETLDDCYAPDAHTQLTLPQKRIVTSIVHLESTRLLARSGKWVRHSERAPGQQIRCCEIVPADKPMQLLSNVNGPSDSIVLRF